MRKFWSSVAVLVLADQITKLVTSELRDFSFSIIRIRTVRNPGLSFGLSSVDNRLSLIVVTVCLAVLVCFHFRGIKRGAKVSGYGLVIAGGISNLLDRFFLGHVRDFLDLGLGFTFNFADAFVVFGLILILLPEPAVEKIKAVSKWYKKRNRA